jgi:hypothetical protein
MNFKVANLVAVQFGIFVGMMVWLGYSHLRFATPRTTTETQDNRTKLVTTVAPMSEPGDERPDTADDGVDREQSEPIVERPVSNQYSPAAVQQYQALATQQYYQQIAPRRYASSSENNSFAAVAPSYAEAAQEPAVEQADEPVPQPVAYNQPTQFIVYQPQILAVSSRQRFSNRCRPSPRSNALLPLTSARPDRGDCRPNGPTDSRPPKSPVVRHHRNVDMSPSQPGRGFAARGRR